MRIFGEVTFSSILESFNETKDSLFDSLFGGVVRFNEIL